MADSFPDAARRHRGDAKSLANGGRFLNAGHLIGFAAECLAKEILIGAGITIDQPPGFREHFPRLADKIRIDGRTRVMALLTPIISTPKFLDGWRPECRYEANIAAHDAELRFNAWHADVDSLFKAARIP